MNEPDLIKQCLKGNALAQQHLYEKFADRLYRLAYRYLRYAAETEDLVMTAFLKIFANLHAFVPQGEGSLEAWMRKIVVNEALMWLRKRHNFHLTESLEPDLPAEDLWALKDLEAEYLYQLVLSLPEGYRTVFNLFVIEGYDHREIAELLDITEGTSRSQLHKARELLKRKIKLEGLHYGT